MEPRVAGGGPDLIPSPKSQTVGQDRRRELRRGETILEIARRSIALICPPGAMVSQANGPKQAKPQIANQLRSHHWPSASAHRLEYGYLPSVTVLYEILHGTIIIINSDG